MTHRRRPALLATLAILVLGLFLAPSLTQATSRLGTSPHQRPDACVACHEPGTGGAPGAPRPIVDTCKSCHPDADMHAVGIAPRDVTVAAGWPLEDGKLTCATCHAEPACDRSRPTIAPWFRGGNPDRPLDFCYRCHTPSRMERVSPHVPGTTGTEGCAACHSGRPAQGAPLADARLRLRAAEACTTCHPGPVHAGAPEHVGAVQERPLPADLAGLLPLDAGNVIACWTCHEVHTPTPAGEPPTRGVAARILAARVVPEGVAAPEAAGAATEATPAPAVDAGPMLALPASDGSLCKACHGSGP